MKSSNKRIVITGMGIVSPLGCNVEHVWSSLLNRESGIRSLPDEICHDIPCKVAGIVPAVDENPEFGFDPDKYISSKDRKKMDRFIEFALVAAHEALVQANWFPKNKEQQNRTATVIATGIGGFNEIAKAVQITDQKGARRLSPFTVPSFLANLAAGHVSINYGFRGPIGAPVTACAAGAQAIGDAARMIKAGEADIAICGGSESTIHRVSLGGFAAARALSTEFNDAPTTASRPFDQQRDGFVMGEGAGILVIESLEHALKRGAQPLGELVGYGTSSDAWHLTAGPEDGNGAARAMMAAINQAGLKPSDINHINAHATSTPVGDKGELAAIKSIFADNSVAVTSTKSATGHLLGAAGGIEAIFTLLALRDDIVPPTLNYQTPDADAVGVNIIGLHAKKIPLTYALSNGFGFGGVNASLLFKKWS
ncbi:beta-ketoacyl-ACP synthase II [Pectobacterium polaris]|uniref:beta-ketoacyl-ACP synthase II n=1 Tax=Pectobacterium polaris TaxID=2042057 RepID=UPI000BC0004A|nr:beta-ketoacyl-ACP synthase II [Pectobacterium polaris]ASY79456.1 beta-ketoacyl-ACP synthase II [Pectobacterium polaris]